MPERDDPAKMQAIRNYRHNHRWTLNPVVTFNDGHLLLFSPIPVARTPCRIRVKLRGALFLFLRNDQFEIKHGIALSF